MLYHGAVEYVANIYMDLCIHDCETRLVVSSEQVSHFSVPSGLKSSDPFLLAF